MKRLFALLIVLSAVVVSMAQEISTDTLIPPRQVWTAPVYVATWEIQYPGDSLPKLNDALTMRLTGKRAGAGPIYWDSTTIIRLKQRGIDTANSRKSYRWKITAELLPR